MAAEKKWTKAEFVREAQALQHTILLALAKECTPFEDVSTAAKKARLDRAENDSEYFLRTYMPHYAESDSTDFHKDIDKTCALKEEISGVKGPRGWAKTARGIHINGTKKALFKQFRYFQIFSYADRAAALKMLAIKVELESNERIKCDFGNQVGNTWNSDLIVLKNGSVIEAKGWHGWNRGSNYLGQRPDDVALDDPETDESARSPIRCKNLLEWFRKSLLPALAPDGFNVIWYGTLLSAYSAFAQFCEAKDEDGNQLYNIVSCQAIENGESTWPDRFPLPKLFNMQRLMGMVAFNQEMQLVAVNPDSIFKPEWLTNSFKLAELDLSKLTIIRGVDPTVGIHCRAGAITFGLDTEKHRFYILQCVCRLLTTMKLLDKLIEMQDAIPARVTIIEENLYKGFLEDVVKQDKKYQRLPIHLETNTGNKELRMESLSGPIENKWFWFDDDIGDTKELKMEFEYYPHYFKDGIDGFEMGYKWYELAMAGVSYKVAEPREVNKITEGW